MPQSLRMPLGLPAGVPLSGSPLLLTLPLLTQGSVFVVDSSHSLARAAVSHGTADRPFATIDYAIGRCTANKGDTVLVMPGHTETVTAAGGLALDVAGVSVIGMGSWGNRPTLTFTTATAASMLVTAAGCRFSNFNVVLTGVDALANPLHIQAADFTLDDCLVTGANATNQAVLALLTTAAANRLRVVGNRFLGTVDAGMTAAIRLVGGDGADIAFNEFMGAYTGTIGAIENVTTALTKCFVHDNKINNLTAACTKAMVFVTGATGQISRNYMQILSGTAPITGDAMSWVGGNSYAATIATAGTAI